MTLLFEFHTAGRAAAFAICIGDMFEVAMLRHDRRVYVIPGIYDDLYAIEATADEMGGIALPEWLSPNPLTRAKRG